MRCATVTDLSWPISRRACASTSRRRGFEGMERPAAMANDQILQGYLWHLGTWGRPSLHVYHHGRSVTPCGPGLPALCLHTPWLSLVKLTVSLRTAQAACPGRRPTRLNQYRCRRNPGDTTFPIDGKGVAACSQVCDQSNILVNHFECRALAGVRCEQSIFTA